jgi:pyridoxamine 5'-phosphate oxidase
MSNHDIAGIRQDYRQASLTEADTAASPLEQFHHWFDAVIKSEISEANAMTLSTVGANGRPHGRIVLLKGADENGFVFFTNYESNKGQELGSQPYAALTFFWKELERQVRVEGVVTKVSDEESDAYFNSRPESSRLGAWASPQSRVIASRTILEQKELELQQQYQGAPIPRPAHWGGYRVDPYRIEFWQGRASRLHDRIVYTKDETGNWTKERLAP